MASAPPSTNVQQETKCSICLEYLKGPMTVDCGHNFCRDCITDHCATREELGEDPECPICRAPIQKRNFRPNWQLANIVEKIKLLPLNLEKERLCVRHKEKLDLFCKEDEELICWKCKHTEHKLHTVLPKEEATEEFKYEIHHQLQILRKKKEKVQACKAEAERESQELLRQIKVETEKTMDQLRKLRQFLEEQEKFWLAQAEKVEKWITRKRDQHLATLSGELSFLDSIIKSTEEKSQQPVSELLQDAKSILQRSKRTFENPAALPLELKGRIFDFCDINRLLEGVIKQFKDALLPGLQLPKAANVTLNPHTAHPKLILSEDQKSVRIGEKQQKLPNNPERFNKHQFVLGQEGFTAGKHFWEVSVGSGGDWAVGVARKSVRRKGLVELCPEQGIWAVRYYAGAQWAWRPAHYFKGTYWASHTPNSCCLSLSGELKRIQVCLSCDGGQVAFYDADRRTLIYTFSGISFSGETLLPFFYIFRKGHLRISS